MNKTDEEDKKAAEIGENSRAPETHEASCVACVAPTTSGSTATATRRTPEMRRSAVRILIQRYFFQLQNGCGNPDCHNINCASSGLVPPMSPNDMAAKAIQLFSQDAQLCETYEEPNMMTRSQTPLPPPTKMDCEEDITTPTTTPTQEAPSTSNNTKDIENLCSQSECSSSSSSTSTNTSSSLTLTTSTSSATQSPNETPFSEISFKPMPSMKLTAYGVHNEEQQQEEASKSSCGSDVETPTSALLQSMNPETIEKLIAEGKRYNNYERLIKVTNEVFSNLENLNQCFRRPAKNKNTTQAKFNTEMDCDQEKRNELLARNPNELKKEDLRTLEGDLDKDEDSTQPAQTEEVSHNEDTEKPTTSAAALHDNGVEPMDADESASNTSAAQQDGETEINALSSETNVDLPKLRIIKKMIFAIPNPEVIDCVNKCINQLAASIKYEREHDWEKVLHCLVICFDLATNSANTPADLEYMERSLPKLCHAAAVLPVNAQARLARIWAAHCSDQLQMLLQCCQQLITLQVILDEDTVRENVIIIAVTKVLKIIFYANILAGQLEPESSLASYKKDLKLNDSSSTFAAISDGASTSKGIINDEDDLFLYSSVDRPHMPTFAENKLEKALQVSCMDCRVPMMPFEDFYNETLSDSLQMHHDYLSYKNLSLERDPVGEDTYFTFMLYAFILTPATKVIALYYDSRMRMYSERNSSLYSILNALNGSGDDITLRPDLKLTVRRDNLIDDALIGLEVVAMSNPKDLKKQLVVEFMGEQGIDEGGVSKEFFQLIVEEIFNPDFGMFVHQEETNNMWFNTTPFENGAQFTLIGIILGLAIYNNVILAVNFPMVVYRKLMGCRGTFHDLNDWSPTLYRSLKSILDYEGDDMEEVFMQTFKIGYNDVFGDVVEHELIPNGGDIMVNQQNKTQFVNLYTDFLLNESVEQQFKAFKKGFEMVTDESPLKLLFRPEEIELLVCGSRKFDFIELEKSTEYDGYTAETQIIKDFWSVVHSMPDDSKRKLLEFTTGSDRIPVGGLSRLRLLITRHGPDTDRLPTSHTCFNVLLLPEYSSKEKLEERLLKAINYSKGFGML